MKSGHWSGISFSLLTLRVSGNSVGEKKSESLSAALQKVWARWRLMENRKQPKRRLKGLNHCFNATVHSVILLLWHFIRKSLKYTFRCLIRSGKICRCAHIYVTLQLFPCVWSRVRSDLINSLIEHLSPKKWRQLTCFKVSDSFVQIDVLLKRVKSFFTSRNVCFNCLMPHFHVWTYKFRPLKHSCLNINPGKFHVDISACNCDPVHL